MRQYAWLELNDRIWYLITDIAADTLNASRAWIGRDAAIADLEEEGWIVVGQYPNQLSEKLRLGNKYRGYALTRTIH